ncbi:MAG: hypothetical protein QG622_3080 [Actinomycetota bacterium]|nr:hypothetical protein [Actinomycetota bacterium]
MRDRTATAMRDEETGRRPGGPGDGYPHGAPLPQGPGSDRRRHWLTAVALASCLGLVSGGVALIRTPDDAARTVAAAPAPEDPQGPLSADTSMPVVTDLTSTAGLEAGVAADFDPMPYAAVNRAAASSSQVTAKDINAALARRTTALRKRDEKAFLATFDPAQPRLLATQRVLFGNLTKLPLVTPVYRAYGIGGSASAKKAQVALLHQIKGVDSEAVELSKIEKWVRRKGTVVTTAVSPVAGQPVTRYAPLDLAPLTVRNGPLVTVVGSADSDLEGLATTAEKAAAAVRATWGTRPGPTRFVIFASHDPKSLFTWFGAKDSPGQAIAVAMPQVAVNHQTKIGGARVVVDLSRTPGEQLDRVLRHEFTHAVNVRTQVLSARTGAPSYPVWAEEGLASWIEEQDLPLEESPRARDLRSFRRYWNRTIPPATRAAFYAGGDRGSYHYDASSMLFRYVGERWGTAKAISFYSALAAGNTKGAWKVLGTDQASFVKAWSGWVDDKVLSKE